jgi:hypothetical protein
MIPHRLRHRSLAALGMTVRRARDDIAQGLDTTRDL